MKHIKLFLPVILLIGCKASSQVDWNKAVKNAEQEVNQYTGQGSAKPTDAEVVQGLKDALNVGTNNSTTSASKVDGYYKNPMLFIPFPPEAVKIKNTVEELGMHKQVQDFEMSLNRAAEEAAKTAAPVFLDAVKAMSIQDGWSILKGADNAATKYLSDKTTAELTSKFTPIIKNAMEKVEVTKYWNPLITAYDKVPFVEKQNPNLEQYVTQRALEGLFKLIADEEKKIRQDPASRVTDILKKVFGYK